MPAINLARQVLLTADSREKALSARQFRSEWIKNPIIGKLVEPLPEQPARPVVPRLVPPSKVPRRRLGSPSGRSALLHAVAHIELNAIDLAADMVARFTHHDDISPADRPEFVSDWSQVCGDEARHFFMINDRLEELGVAYGDHPAHNGLWEAAQSTCDNFPARVAIAPLVLEARGLDVTPGMIKKLNQVGDDKSAAILQVIYEEEIAHVATGAKWFQYLARRHNEQPESWFHYLVRNHFKGRVKSPFNEKARTLAGLSRAFYEPLAANSL